MAGHMKQAKVLLSLAVVALLVSVAVADVPTLLYDGQTYVDLARLTADLKAKTAMKPDSVYADMRIGTHTVRFTRNWGRIMVDGSPLVLDAPARVKDGRWIVPKSFVTDVLPRLTSAAVVAPSVPVPAALPPREALALEEVRVRS